MSEFRLFKYPLTIREHHLDTFGHVNNAVYLQIMEEARWEILVTQGFGLDYVRKNGIGPVILEIHLAFRHELLLRSNVVIETQALTYEKVICKLQQVIRDESGRVCTEATFTMALWDTRARKIIPPTDEFMKCLR